MLGALARRYFAVWAWERDGRVYERLGVRVARRFVAGGPFWTARRARRTGARRRLLPGKRAAARYVRQSVAVEAAHATSFLVLCAPVMAEWRGGRPGWAVAWAAGNVLVNGYPVLVQRYNRAWIARILGRSPTGAPPARG